MQHDARTTSTGHVQRMCDGNISLPLICAEVGA